MIVAISRSVDVLSGNHRTLFNFLYLYVLCFFLAASGQGKKSKTCEQAS
jgi:hypothetical protein